MYEANLKNFGLELETEDKSVRSSLLVWFILLKEILNNDLCSSSPLTLIRSQKMERRLL